MCVETDFDFALLPAAGDSRLVDLEFVRGHCFPPASAAARHFGSSASTPGALSGFEDENGVQIQIGSVGRYWLKEGTRVMSYELDQCCSHADAQHWFSGFVLGVVAQLQQRTVLHASAVMIDGKGVAFIGVGGTGKTTLAASFGRVGVPVLSEDSLPVRVEPEGVVATPYVPGIRLWPQSLAELGGTDSSYDLALSWQLKRRVPIGGEWGRVAQEEAPLGAVYDLSPNLAGSGEIVVDEITGAEKVMRLVGSTYFAEVLSPLQQVKLMDRLKVVADAVRMRRITYPRTFEALPALREAISRDATEVAHGRI